KNPATTLDLDDKKADRDKLARSPVGFEEHSQRISVLGELHARPLLPTEIPRAVFHFGFMTDEAAAIADRARVADMAKARGLPSPDAHAKYHRFDFGRWDLRWEQHTEFTTYTWSTGISTGEPFSLANPLKDGEVQFTAPGPLIVAVNLSLLDRSKLMANVGDFFKPESLCVIKASDGQARVATDFVVDTSGFTRILVESKGMSETHAGRLVQRVLEIETYRTLALLGLPTARSIGPELGRMEKELAQVTAEIAGADDHHESQVLLKHLGRLAADIEALSAKNAFRFGATRAYFELVKSRIELIQERPDADHVSITAFFNRRLVPAIETCNAVETRQERLSLQLARAADLLRTGIQFDLEQQNRDLLKSMDQRAKMQLRLQQTVEGLSVAAISYYIVGLITYLAKGLSDLSPVPERFSPTIVTALSVPLVVGGVWYLTRRLKEHYVDDKADSDRSSKGG
ncbi:MAG: DUF3422 domain-containing protein, partial [Pseudomonadota bacterium]